jgi:hypothetical protein
MDLDRNTNPDGLGKYALINLRKLNEQCESPETFHRWTPAIEQALETLEKEGVLEWGKPGAVDEFFVIKLRDLNAPDALLAYAQAAKTNGDPEFSGRVWDLACRSGRMSPFAQLPD